MVFLSQNDADFEIDHCVLCDERFDEKAPSTRVFEKGLATLKRLSKERKLDSLHTRLVGMQSSGQSIKIHHSCRRKFVDTRQTDAEPAVKKLRSCSSVFEWKTHCFFCSCVTDKKRQHENPVRRVMTLECRSRLLQRAEERNDTWGNLVKGRFECCNDLVAEEAVYHSKCMSKCLKVEGESSKVGRPIDTEKSDAFVKLCSWLEEYGDCELHTINQVWELMKKMSKGEVYNLQTLKRS